MKLQEYKEIGDRILNDEEISIAEANEMMENLIVELFNMRTDVSIGMTRDEAKKELNDAFKKFNCGHDDKGVCSCESNPFGLEQTLNKIYDSIECSCRVKREQIAKDIRNFVDSMHHQKAMEYIDKLLEPKNVIT